MTHQISVGSQAEAGNYYPLYVYSAVYADYAAYFHSWREKMAAAESPRWRPT